MEENYKNYVNNEDLADGVLYTSEGEAIHTHSALLARYFSSYSDFLSYLEDINRQYSKTALLSLLEMLYKGYGKFQPDHIHIKYSISLPETINRRHFLNQMIAETESNERNVLKLAHQSAERTTEVIVPLKHSEFGNFMEKRHEQWFTDAALLANGSVIRVNKATLAMSSPYFRNLFSGSYQEGEEVRLYLPSNCSIVLNILINYLMMGVVVVTTDFTTQSWMELAELSEYFCLETLKAICESQLCSKVQKENTL